MKRKTLLLTIRTDNTEMEELIYSQGSELVGTIYQRRPHEDPQFHLGRGKLDEAREYQQGLEASLVIVNASLKPNQIFNLQQFFSGRQDDVGSTRTTRDGVALDPTNIEVWDRTRLILEIFRERARSPEARLQVELAQLLYDTPLVKESIHLARKGEHPGFLGGGEYEVNQYYDMMKKRVARIKRELQKIRHERGLRRKHRRRGGHHLVSLAGYTNAGKSSLLKRLAQSPTHIENRYFSTLSTKTRRAASDKRDILLTDTVGFIEDLPPWMVDAFHSTLEEIAFADVTLLVLDGSDPVEEMARRLKSSLRVLWTFDASPAESTRGVMPLDPNFAAAARMSGSSAGMAPILVVLNKNDLLTPGELDAKTQRLCEDGLLNEGSFVSVSAESGNGIDALFERIYALFPDYDRYEVALPQTPQCESFLAWLHDSADVVSLTRGNEVHVVFEAKRVLTSQLEVRLAELGATRLRIDPLDAPAANVENVEEDVEADLPDGSDESAAAPDAALEL